MLPGPTGETTSLTSRGRRPGRWLRRERWSRLAELGLSPPVVAPLAAYQPAVRTATSSTPPGSCRSSTVVGAESGQGVRGCRGHRDAGAGEGRGAQLLPSMRSPRSTTRIDSIVRVVKVVGFVASANGPGQPPSSTVSVLLGEVFGDAGKHARSAVGVSELPLGTGGGRA